MASSAFFLFQNLHRRRHQANRKRIERVIRVFLPDDRLPHNAKSRVSREIDAFGNFNRFRLNAWRIANQADNLIRDVIVLRIYVHITAAGSNIKRFGQRFAPPRPSPFLRHVLRHGCAEHLQVNHAVRQRFGRVLAAILRGLRADAGISGFLPLIYVPIHRSFVSEAAGGCAPARSPAAIKASIAPRIKTRLNLFMDRNNSGLLTAKPGNPRTKETGRPIRAEIQVSLYHAAPNPDCAFFLNSLWTARAPQRFLLFGRTA